MAWSLTRFPEHKEKIHPSSSLSPVGLIVGFLFVYHKGYRMTHEKDSRQTCKSLPSTDTRSPHRKISRSGTLLYRGLIGPKKTSDVVAIKVRISSQWIEQGRMFPRWLSERSEWFRAARGIFPSHAMWGRKIRTHYFSSFTRSITRHFCRNDYEKEELAEGMRLGISEFKTRCSRLAPFTLQIIGYHWVTHIVPTFVLHHMMILDTACKHA